MSDSVYPKPWPATANQVLEDIDIIISTLRGITESDRINLYYPTMPEVAKVAYQGLEDMKQLVRETGYAKRSD